MKLFDIKISNLSIFLFFISLPILHSQSIVSGIIRDTESKAPLLQATITIEGTALRLVLYLILMAVMNYCYPQETIPFNFAI